MMWQTLARLGGSAARHPWRVITMWLVVAVVVPSGPPTAAGGKTTDSMSVPGLDSPRAEELLGQPATTRRA